jgi:hypothetical protein
MLAPVIPDPPPTISFHENPAAETDAETETTVDATGVPATVAYRLSVLDAPAEISSPPIVHTPPLLHEVPAIVVLPSAILTPENTGEVMPDVDVENVRVVRVILPAASAEIVTSPILFSAPKFRELP